MIRSYLVLLGAFAFASAMPAQQSMGSIEALLEGLTQPDSCITAESNLESSVKGDRYRLLLSERLPTLLQTTPSVEAKRCMAELAGNLRLSSAIKPLGALLEDYRTIPLYSDNYHDRELIGDPFAAALVKLGAIPELSVHLQSKKLSARSRAARALMKIGTPAARKALLAHLSTEEDTGMKSMIKGYLSS